MYVSGVLPVCLADSSLVLSVLASLGVEVVLVCVLGLHVYLTAREVIKNREEAAPYLSAQEGINTEEVVPPSHPSYHYLRRSLSHLHYNQASIGQSFKIKTVGCRMIMKQYLKSIPSIKK